MHKDHSNLDLLKNNAKILGGVLGAETKYVENNEDTITN